MQQTSGFTILNPFSTVTYCGPFQQCVGILKIGNFGRSVSDSLDKNINVVKVEISVWMQTRRGSIQRFVSGSMQFLHIAFQDTNNMFRRIPLWLDL
ncbi:unnamed protein product [Taenia asiatica]|uniref:Ovule protein n=1 Tax=Taenia asiatica TaxID=60517 RepID=A0A0R3WGE6_TAEAS|nr:unnamed protein product [Taenia asiatica]